MRSKGFGPAWSWWTYNAVGAQEHTYYRGGGGGEIFGVLPRGAPGIFIAAQLCTVQDQMCEPTRLCGGVGS